MLKRALQFVAALFAAGNLALLFAFPVATPPTVVYSSNWSGYAFTGAAGEFSGVSAEWRVPEINCAKTPFADASQWVGLDGFTDKTVEQLGTETLCEFGMPLYGAWFEMYPADPAGADLTVHPGDLMQATIVVSGSAYVLVIRDLTTGKFDAAVAQCGSQCERSSAEVVSEAPSDASGVLPLSDFGVVNFSDVALIANGSYVTNEIVDRQSGQILAQPSAFANHAFSVTWKGEGD